MRILLLATALACGPSLDQIRVRELCYTRAEAAAQARVDRECYAAGQPFAACPARPDILAQLQREQEACP